MATKRTRCNYQSLYPGANSSCYHMQPLVHYKPCISYLGTISTKRMAQPRLQVCWLTMMTVIISMEVHSVC